MYHIDIFQNHLKSIFPELFLVTAIFIILLYAVIYNPMTEKKETNLKYVNAHKRQMEKTQINNEQKKEKNNCIQNSYNATSCTQNIKKETNYKYKYNFPILTSVIGWLSVQILIITILLMANQSVPTSTIILNNVLIIDDFSVIIKMVILFSALSSILTSFGYIKSQKMNSFEFTILILFATLSMLFIVSSYDLISMYLAIEFQSLSFYVLAAFQRNDEFSTEAGLKYFILGAVSSGLLLFGESLIYGFTGITNFEELSKLLSFHSLPASNAINLSTIQILEENTQNQYVPRIENVYEEFSTIFAHETIFGTVSTNAVIIGLLFIIVAFLFKISAAPFHMWTPDVYEGAPTNVTAFFAITPKIAVLALLLRLCLYTFFDLIESWQNIIIISAILSIFIGTFGALNQNKIKRLFAYSSIAHVGYMLIGLAVATLDAIESVLLYILLYIPMIINVFGILLAMPRATVNPNSFYKANCTSLVGSYMYKWSQRHNLQKKNVKDSSEFNSYPGNIVSHLSVFFFPLIASILYQTENTHFKQITSLPENDWECHILKASHPIWNPYKKHNTDKNLKEKLCVNILDENTQQTKTISWQNISGDMFFIQGIGNDKNKKFYDQIDNLQSIPFIGINSFKSANMVQKKKEDYLKYITDLASVSKSNKLLAATFAIILFSNAGVPPLAGFYGKLNIFLASVEASMYFIAIAGVICSVMGAFYSIRLIKIIYFHSLGSGINEWTWYRQISKENSIILGLTFFFILFFFLYPSCLFTITHLAALSLCL